MKKITVQDYSTVGEVVDTSPGLRSGITENKERLTTNHK